MEEEEEDPEEDPEMEEEEEEMEADEQWDGPEWILPYQGADPLYPPPPASESEYEAKADPYRQSQLRDSFTDYSMIGRSSSSAAAGT
ncbi:hypothetical protein Tco_0105488 [Tanacetum coccineum]